MSGVSEFFSEWPYLVWAFGIASAFYAVTVFAVSHLHADKKANLSLWLQGDYQSTWSAQFCNMFDSAFGEKHFRLRCFLLSAIASILAVFSLWLLFDYILGLISLRAVTGLSLTEALILGALINVVPDYISLCETRWLLKLFARVRNPLGQLVVLILDTVVTSLIIFAGIKLYLMVTGKPQISLVEMIGLFSFYAIFFYSTFLTSTWAWAYCLSSWISKISANLLDARNAPGRSLALVGAAIVFVGSLGLKPALTMNEDGRIAVDEFLCSAFPTDACTHVARLTKDDKLKLIYLSRACIGGVTEECLGTGKKLYKVKPEQAAILWTKSCDGGNAEGCANLAQMYRFAFGVDEDTARAIDLYKQSCDGGNAVGCTELGTMYRLALGVDQDYVRAVSLYKEGCDGEDAIGCTNLGYMYRYGLGVDQDIARAIDLYKQSCDGGSALGCTNLGVVYRYGLIVDQDIARAADLYKQGCDGGSAQGCAYLAGMYKSGTGVDQDYARAVDLYKRGCDGGHARGCTYLGTMYDDALGVDQDYARAVDLYKRGCDGGSTEGCTYLGFIYNNALGVDQDYARAVDLYKRGCDGGHSRGCTYLGIMYDYARGVDQDYARAVDLYKRGCDGGHALGCTYLGTMFDEAIGVDQDIEKARALYKQACAMREDWACNRLNDLDD